MRADRWEHGSDFAYPEIAPRASSERWQPPGATYWHSGRDALRALLRALAPRRVFFPSFYCHDVYDAADGLELRVYADGPTDERIDIGSLELRDGDVLVVTNTYGLRRASPVAAPLPAGVTLVEDHTHDPLSRWARESRADYALASLRKWLPLPDGAVLWAPTGRPPVEAPAFDPRQHAAAAAVTLDRLSAMLLKQRYLEGEPLEKDAFRRLAIAGEGAIGRGSPSPMSPVSRALLDVVPAAAWRASRRSNHEAFVARLGDVPRVRVLSSGAGGDAVPFAAVLVFDDPATRDDVRARLVAERVYPAVLWPLASDRAAGIPAAHVDLSTRILCLHCDHRYDASDMKRVATAVRRSLGAA